MSRHATFENFGMAFLTLFQVSTGDNWNGIMKVLVGRLKREQPEALESLRVRAPVPSACPIAHRRGVRAPSRSPGSPRHGRWS
jgi:hypothetical protein